MSIPTDVGSILGGGAVGGVISTLLPQVDVPIVSSVFLSALLGAIAAYLFIFVISHTDTADTRRLIALSIVAGMAWQPVIVGLRDGQRNAALSNDLRSTRDIAVALQEFHGLTRPDDPEAKASYALGVDTALNEVAEYASNVRTDDAQNAVAAMVSTALGDHDDPERTQSLVEELNAVGVSVSHGHALPDAADVQFNLTPESGPLNVEAQGDGDVFLRMVIVEPARYSISITSTAGRDLVAAIHRAGDPVPLVANDDYRGSRDPQIDASLEQGVYYVHISEFLGRAVSTFTATLSQEG